EGPSGSGKGKGSAARSRCASPWPRYAAEDDLERHLIKAHSPSPLPTRQELQDLLLERLRDHTAEIGIALAQGRREHARLLDGDVRRKWRHIWIAERVDDHWAIGRERLIPRAFDLVRCLDPDSLQTDQVGVCRVV